MFADRLIQKSLTLSFNEFISYFKWLCLGLTAEKMKFSIKDFFSKCDRKRDSGIPVNFAKFLRTSFFKEHLRWMPLEVDFTVMSLICNICEPVFPKMIS